MHMLLNKFSETIMLSVRVVTKPFENIICIEYIPDFSDYPFLSNSYGIP